MQKRINFNQNNQISIKDEVLTGILLDINPILADGLTVANISDLNKIGVDLLLVRANGKQEYIYNDYLENILRALYVGTTKLDIFKTKRSTGYTIPLQFGGVLVLSKGDELKLSIWAQTTSFTSLSVSNSSINVETIPSNSYIGSVLYKVVSDSIPVGTSSIDQKLAENTVKLIVATDFTADYFASTKAKAQNYLIKEFEREVKNVSENLLISENLLNLANNPSTLVYNLIVYAGNPLKSGRVIAKFNQAVDSTAKLLQVASFVI